MTRPIRYELIDTGEGWRAEVPGKPELWGEGVTREWAIAALANACGVDESDLADVEDDPEAPSQNEVLRAAGIPDTTGLPPGQYVVQGGRILQATIEQGPRPCEGARPVTTPAPRPLPGEEREAEIRAKLPDFHAGEVGPCATYAVVWDLLALLGTARAEADRLRALAVEWVPVGEATPPTEGHYLIALPDGTVQVRYWPANAVVWGGKTVAWAALPAGPGGEESEK